MKFCKISWTRDAVLLLDIVPLFFIF
uniref:Uncharacterized protein n=1 Tax=Rhizophora mucronata TaxID=61149 RepID=A0A2P2N7J0_RHIMU